MRILNQAINRQNCCSATSVLGLLTGLALVALGGLGLIKGRAPLLGIKGPLALVVATSGCGFTFLGAVRLLSKGDKKHEERSLPVKLIEELANGIEELANRIEKGVNCDEIESYRKKRLESYRKKRLSKELEASKTCDWLLKFCVKVTQMNDSGLIRTAVAILRKQLPVKVKECLVELKKFFEETEEWEDNPDNAQSWIDKRREIVKKIEGHAALLLHDDFFLCALEALQHAFKKEQIDEVLCKFPN